MNSKGDGPSLEEMMQAPIRVRDATSMFRIPVSKNEKPYDVEVKKLNNKLVDAWERDILLKTANDKGEIPASRAFKSWYIFEEGVYIPQMLELADKGLLPLFSEGAFEHWKDFFANATFEDLHRLGVGNVARVWRTLDTHSALIRAREIYEELYGLYEDPIDWERHSHEITRKFEANNHPFWSYEQFMDIRERVETIMRYRIEPRGIEGMHQR